MPKNGLPTNIALNELLKFKPTCISRGKAYDTLLATINDLLKKQIS